MRVNARKYIMDVDLQRKLSALLLVVRQESMTGHTVCKLESTPPNKCSLRVRAGQSTIPYKVALHRAIPYTVRTAVARVELYF